MIVNGRHLIHANPIKDMVETKNKSHGLSWGLSEVGYDLRVKQEIRFIPPNPFIAHKIIDCVAHESDQQTLFHLEYEFLKANFGYTTVGNDKEVIGKCALASSVEEFQLPDYLWGELRNKSSLARKFIDATIGTDMEPGWKGFLTIEIIFHGLEPITIEAGSPIAKAVFHEISSPTNYSGKYQNQADKPVPSIAEL